MDIKEILCELEKQTFLHEDSGKWLALVNKAMDNTGLYEMSGISSVT
jgi:hypothetical protein